MTSDEKILRLTKALFMAMKKANYDTSSKYLQKTYHIGLWIDYLNTPTISAELFYGAETVAKVQGELSKDDEFFEGYNK